MSSSDDIFISTQIQSRLDDIEMEEELKVKRKTLLEKFMNVPPVPLSSSSLSSGALEVSKPESKKKGTKKKPSNRRKKANLSVTEQMILKLSGKPQKYNRMIHTQGLNSVDVPLSRDYDNVFDSKEWQTVRFSLHLNGQCHYGNNDELTNDGRVIKEEIGEGDMTKDDGNIQLWSVASQAPVDLQDSSMCNGTIPTAVKTDDFDSAITLSQCLLPLLDHKEEQPDEIIEIEDSEGELTIIDVEEFCKLNGITTTTVHREKRRIKVPFYGINENESKAPRDYVELHDAWEDNEVVYNTTDDETDMGYILLEV